jgi:hypothetical protein
MEYCYIQFLFVFKLVINLDSNKIFYLVSIICIDKTSNDLRDLKNDECIEDSTNFCLKLQDYPTYC